MMITDKINNILLKFSQVTSYLLHPLLTTLYIAIIVLFGDTYLNSSNISLQFKLILLLYIALLTVVVPLLSFYLLYAFKLVSSFKLPTRSDRIIPLLVITICYLVSMYVFSGMIGQMLAQKLFFTIAIVASVANIVTFYDTISLHSLGAAVAVAFLIAFDYVGYGDMETPIIVAVILSGLLATCRLYLAKHALTEIALSYIVGLLTTLILLWI